MNWFACELHCHTFHSDGLYSPALLAEKARELALDGIALTDHNTLSGFNEIAAACGNSPCFLGGIEWTTFYGHMLVMGCGEFVDWRGALPGNIDEKTREIAAKGGVAGAAHPFALGSPMCTGCYWDFQVGCWDNISFMEVWSGPSPWSSPSSERAFAMWNALLDKGYRIAATYGRDWHSDPAAGEAFACTWLGSESASLTPGEMKNALKAGRVCVSAGPLLSLRAVSRDGEAGPGGTIPADDADFVFAADLRRRKEIRQPLDLRPETFRLIGAGGQTVSDIPFSVPPSHIRIEAAPGWYRGELWGTIEEERCLLAFTSPIYAVDSEVIRKRCER